MKCTFMTHLYWVVLPDFLRHSVLVNLFPWFRSSTWRPSSEPRAQGITPHLCLVFPDTVWVRINKTVWTGSWLFVATTGINIWSIGQYQQEIRPWWSFYPFQMYQTLPSSAVFPHYQETCHCDSECPAFVRYSSLRPFWSSMYVEMVKEPGQQSYRKPTYYLVHVMKFNLQIQLYWT